MKQDLDVARWSVSDSAELYEIDGWGKGYFSIGPTGNVLVHPTKEQQRAIDLRQLIDRMQQRGLHGSRRRWRASSP